MTAVVSSIHGPVRGAGGGPAWHQESTGSGASAQTALCLLSTLLRDGDLASGPALWPQPPPPTAGPPSQLTAHTQQGHPQCPPKPGPVARGLGGRGRCGSAPAWWPVRRDLPRGSGLWEPPLLTEELAPLGHVKTWSLAAR